MTKIDLDDPRLRECTSKVRHQSAAKAHTVLKKSPFRKVLTVYRCPWCSMYHIGSKSTFRKGD